MGDTKSMVDFWGVKLSEKQRKLQWPKSEDELDPDITVRLELRQACLGSKAKDGERNVVELTAEDESGEEVTHTIVSLTVGKTEHSPLFLEVFPPATFNLVSGSGPIHIVGTAYTEFDDLTTDEEEEDVEEEQEEEEMKGEADVPLSGLDKKNSRKRTASSLPTKPAKATKLADSKMNGGDGMEIFLDQDMYKDLEASEGEEDEEYEVDEEEEDDEEDEEEEEEESDQQEDQSTKKTPLKAKIKSSLKQAPQFQKPKPVQFKTPQPPKAIKTQSKVTASAPTTPKQGKDSKKPTKTVMSVEQIKEKLKKTPTLPRKPEKFKNYIQHNFKITDEKMKKQLWDFIQKTRGDK